MSPYLVLAVPPAADDEAIRQAYLQAVKESPPDSDPARFQTVSQAYGQIKDQASRHRHFLFNRDCPADSPLEVLARYAACRRHFQPFSLAVMKEFLNAAAKGGGK